VKVVVTGGAGFIGANLTKRLSSDGIRGEGVEVVVLDDLSSGRRENLDGVPAQLVVGSILDDSVLDEVVAGSSAIVHLAAVPSVPRSIEDPMRSHEANATGTLRVLEAARRAGGPQVIVASSSSVYGANPQLPKHEGLRPVPMSPYAVSKLATETYALAHAHCYSLDVLALRFFNVFGPLQAAGHAYAAVIPAFVDAALDGRPLPLNGDGSQSRDFTFVDTVTAVIADAVARRVTSPEPVNLAFGTRTSLTALIAELGSLLGRDLEVETREPRPGDVPHSQADSSRLRELFPNVRPVPLAEGLKATVGWFEEVRQRNGRAGDPTTT
jgi:UDP-glucose 4-epimerase